MPDTRKGSARRHHSTVTSRKPRTCGNCGNTQGPFDKLFIGFRKTGRWVFTCPIPKKDANGKPLTDAQRRELAMACINRREKRNGAAQEVDAGGSRALAGQASGEEGQDSGPVEDAGRSGPELGEARQDAVGTPTA